MTSKLFKKILNFTSIQRHKQNQISSFWLLVVTTVKRGWQFLVEDVRTYILIECFKLRISWYNFTGGKTDNINENFNGVYSH